MNTADEEMHRDFHKNFENRYFDTINEIRVHIKDVFTQRCIQCLANLL